MGGAKDLVKLTSESEEVTCHDHLSIHLTGGMLSFSDGKRSFPSIYDN